MANSMSASLTSDEADRSLLVRNTLLCNSCEEDGKTEQAHGYCVDCCEHLCATCFSHHCTPRPCRNHKLLDKYQMPRTKTYKDECTDECGIHAGEILKYFCEEHKQFICPACYITGDHQTCTVGYIPELSKDLLENQEFRTFENKLNAMRRKTSNVKTLAGENLGDIDTFADRSLDRIRQFRKEINEFFDKLENDFIEKVSQVRAENKDKISPLIDQSQELADKIEEIKNIITEKKEKEQKCSLFVDMKNFQTKLEEYSMEISRFEETNKIREFAFSPSKVIKYFISDDSEGFGDLVDFKNTISAKLKDDRKPCCFEAVAILKNDRIAVCDPRNKSLKVIDTHQGKVLTWKSLPHQVWGINAVSDNDIAVMWDGNIDIYTVTNEIKLTKTIKNTTFKSYVLAYSNGRFVGVTSSSPPRIKIVDMNGVQVKTLPAKLNGADLFESPEYISISPDQTAIYVSDFGIKTVTCLTFDGEVRARYKPERGWLPRCVAVSRDGTVYVADSCKTIHILSSDLQEICVINGSKYGIRNPLGLAYCDRDHKLYVSMWENNEIVVLNI